MGKTIYLAAMLFLLSGCLAPTPSPTPQPLATMSFLLQLISDPKVKEIQETAFLIKAEHPNGIRAGTGMAVDEGLILTAFHLVGDPYTGKVTAKEIRVSQSHTDWKGEVPAQVAAADPLLDLAVLKFELARELPSLSFGNPDQLRPGDTIYLIGHEVFPTHGIGILYPRDGQIPEDFTVEKENAFFVISPPVVRGFCGGGVFNKNHELVGITIKGYVIWEEKKGRVHKTEGTIVRKINCALPLLEK